MLPVGVARAGCRPGPSPTADFLKLSAAVVAEEEIGHRVVADEDVGVAVIVEIARRLTPMLGPATAPMPELALTSVNVPSPLLRNRTSGTGGKSCGPADRDRR